MFICFIWVDAHFNQTKFHMQKFGMGFIEYVVMSFMRIYGKRTLAAQLGVGLERFSVKCKGMLRVAMGIAPAWSVDDLVF